MAQSAGNSPIDAKRMPAAIAVGAILLILGIIVTAWGLYSIVSAAMDGLDGFGLVGGLLITPLGILLSLVGGALIVFGIAGKLFGGRYRRIMY